MQDASFIQVTIAFRLEPGAQMWILLMSLVGQVTGSGLYSLFFIRIVTMGHGCYLTAILVFVQQNSAISYDSWIISCKVELFKEPFLLGRKPLL